MEFADGLRIGPLTLPYWLLALGVGALVLKVTLGLLLGRDARRWDDRVWTAGLGGLVVWKLSPVVSAWDTVVREPLALLYLPGTQAGLFVALAASGAWLIWHLVREPGPRGRLAGSLALALALAALPSMVLGALPARSTSASVGPALSSLDGRSQVLGEAPGRVLFVNFWATWCPPCRAEIPEFVRFWDEADHEKVAIQAVDLLLTEEGASRVAAFVEEQGMDFPVLLDDLGLADHWEITSVPTTLVFDPQGRLVARHVGALSKEKLESFVRQYSP